MELDKDTKDFFAVSTSLEAMALQFASYTKIYCEGRNMVIR